MSGGVDSSVAALLLKEQGYQVEGLFMKNWEEDDTDNYCSATADLQDAQAICDTLAIPLHTVNFAAEYWDIVFEYFLTEYKAGRTPNPDILCNKEIKFKIFLEYAKSLGADCIATGHYARKLVVDDKFMLAQASDQNKDQSYFLYTLNQQQLSSSLFPLANIKKDEIRNIAKANGFINHHKKDSTGICFIGERKFKDFLQRFIPAQPGPIVTEDNKLVGQHEGLMFYTLGQRQGLGIGGIKTAANEPWYVVKKDLVNNKLIIAQGRNHPLLYSNTLHASNLHWINPQLETVFNCTAKIRYRQNQQNCHVQIIESGTKCIIVFEEPQRAITPGQSVVLYNKHLCLGGGIIE